MARIPEPCGAGLGSPDTVEQARMKALVWHGKEDIRCDTVSEPV